MAVSPFSYAVYRVVPRVERGERLNVGVVLFSRPLGFLAARTHVDEARVGALWPDLDAMVEVTLALVDAAAA